MINHLSIFEEEQNIEDINVSLDHTFPMLKLEELQNMNYS